MDKAGAYAVQDEDFRPAKRVTGCYSNAVGLPLCKVIELLESAGIKASLRPEFKGHEPCIGKQSGGCEEADAE